MPQWRRVLKAQDGKGAWKQRLVPVASAVSRASRKAVQSAGQDSGLKNARASEVPWWRCFREALWSQNLNYAAQDFSYLSSCCLSFSFITNFKNRGVKSTAALSKFTHAWASPPVWGWGWSTYFFNSSRDHSATFPPVDNYHTQQQKVRIHLGRGRKTN